MVLVNLQYYKFFGCAWNFFSNLATCPDYTILTLINCTWTHGYLKIFNGRLAQQIFIIGV